MRVISVVLATQWVLFINFDIMLLSLQFTELPELYINASIWLDYAIYEGIYLTVSLAFYYLADVDFEVKQANTCIDFETTSNTH